MDWMRHITLPSGLMPRPLMYRHDKLVTLQSEQKEGELLFC